MKNLLTTLTIGLAVAMAAAGCGSSGDFEQPGPSQSSDIRPVTVSERSQLNLPPGFTVVGALPTITALAPSDGNSARLEDDIQGGGGGAGPYYMYDYYYLGFSGRAGSYIDQLTFYGATETTQAYGGGGGSAFGEITCPVTSQGQTYMVGMIGRSGSYIDQLGPMCGTSTSGSITWTSRGGGGGQAFNYRCPLNTWIIGWGIRAGGYVDQLTCFCGTSP